MSVLSLFSQNLVKNKYIFFDFETTGLYPLDGCRVIEIAMIKTVDGKIEETLETMINPGIPIPEEASRTNHITDEMVADAQVFDYDFSLKILKFIDDGILVAHNAAFDLAFLTMELARNGITFDGWSAIDTLKIAKKVFPSQRNALSILMKRYNIAAEGDLHRAIVDTEILKKVYFELIDESDIRELTVDTVIKKYGYKGNLIHRFIPAKIRELIIEKKEFEADYQCRDHKKINLKIKPLAPIWCNNMWFLLVLDVKKDRFLSLHCKKILKIY